MDPIRLAVVGCGKVSERFHLPVATAHPRFEVVAVVDRDASRARSMAERFAVRHAVTSIDELAGLADAAIVATPHHLHAPMTSTLLGQSVHVLVEKPMALDVAGCDAMIAAAAASGRVLAVGLVRRFYQASRFVKEVLDDGDLGTVTAVDAREGAVFGWQVVSDATFRRDQGGGVLSDIGAHVLDLLAWWLGDPGDLTYADDAMGGVEAECEIGMTFPNGATGRVDLSRTRLLRNTIHIQGERGSIELGPSFDPEVRLELGRRGRRLSGTVAYGDAPRAARLEDVFVAQLDDFARAIDEGTEPLVPGREGRRSIALLDACRRARRPLELPWLHPTGRGPSDGYRG